MDANEQDANEQYRATVGRCEATAKGHGHTTTGVWYYVSDQLHASLCAVCCAMVWVTRPGQEKRWRIGGAAIEQDCPQEEQDCLKEDCLEEGA